MRAWIILALAPLAFAQQQDVLIQREGATIQFHPAPAAPAAAAGQQQDVLIRREGPMQVQQVFSHATAPVKGAPYSAEAVTESTQRLADGTRISNTSSTKTYRDSEGRTRTDASIKALGPWVQQGGAGRTISTIFDPLTSESITLHHEAKSATRHTMKPSRLPFAGVKAEAGKQPMQVEVEKRVIVKGASASADAVVEDVLMPGPGTMHWVHEEPVIAAVPLMERERVDVQKKPLGKRQIEGVECEGTLLTLTVPEGQVGNDRPIEVTTETWRSAELKIDLLRRHNDPRFGETTYRVINVVRAEQPRSLFEVPAGYEVKAMPATFNIKLDAPKQIR